MTVREDRFNALYQAHYRAIYAYAYRRLPLRAGEVPDVTAEVFAVAWRRLDEVPAGEEELPWLYAVAHRCVQRARRTDLRRVRLLGRLADEARTRMRIGSASGEAGSREDTVRAAIERLRPRDREVLRLVMWEGLTHAAAAGVLGCSVNAVAQRLHTARERLRAELSSPASGAPEMTTN